MAKAGRPSIGDTTLNLRVPSQLREHFAEQARREGVALSRYLRDVLARVMAEEQRAARESRVEGNLLGALQDLHSDAGAWKQWQQQLRASPNSALSIVFANVPEDEWEEAVGEMFTRLYARHACRDNPAIPLPRAFYLGVNKSAFVHWDTLLRVDVHSSADLEELERALEEVLRRADLSRGFDWDQLYEALRVWNCDDRRPTTLEWARVWVDLTRDDR